MSFFDRSRVVDMSRGTRYYGADERRFRWWHILLIVLAVVLVAAIIVGIVLWNKVSDHLDGDAGDTIDGDTVEPDGVVTSVGTYLSKNAGEYILCEYKEYFSGETKLAWQKPEDMRYAGAYYIFVSENGIFHEKHSGAYTGEKTPEQVKADLLAEIQAKYKYTDENIARCSVHVYQPVTFSRVTVSSATLTENAVSVTLRAGAVDGTLSDEYTLTGTYVKTENDFTFTYTDLPEDAHLRHVAEKLLARAEYSCYALYGEWVNTLTFAEMFKMTLNAAGE